MTAPLPMTDADTFFKEIGQRSIHDVIWLNQRKNRLINAIRKNRSDMPTRLALGVTLAHLGEREAAVVEAEAAFGLRHSCDPYYLMNLSLFSLNLGMTERALDLVDNCRKLPQVWIQDDALLIARAIALNTGNIDLWRTIRTDPRLQSRPEDIFFDLLDEFDALEAYAQHQRIVFETIGKHLCKIELEYLDDDGAPFIAMRYDIAASRKELRELEERLFLAVDATCWRDGKPWCPYAAILTTRLCGLPLEADSTDEKEEIA